jgi:plasmid stabilization system protein ParE
MSPDRPYRFHPEASEELEAADDWYFARSVDASIDFLSNVDGTIESITQAPHSLAEAFVRKATICSAAISFFYRLFG